jgi:predicted ferric reductase
MSIWEAVTWEVARAGGFTAYILLTLAVIVGLALSTQLQSPRRWPRLLNNELHNFLTLLSMIFIIVHVLAVWIDPFTKFGWNEVFIPLASHYRPVWMAFGIVALYLGIAIGISTWIRPLIGYKWWRRLHVLTLLGFGLVTIHGIGTGSDTQTWWGLGIYLVSIVLVGSLVCRRFLISANKRKQIPAQPPAHKIERVPARGQLAGSKINSPTSLGSSPIHELPKRQVMRVP